MLDTPGRSGRVEDRQARFLIENGDLGLAEAVFEPLGSAAKVLRNDEILANLQGPRQRLSTTNGALAIS